jgi:tRNA dimethylallyltransferase
MMKPLVVMLGPTAVGKTALGIRLCQKIDGEIVSGDSMLVYRGMDIGTAKPTLEERQGIPHYMIDILDPHEAYSVADFQALATKFIEEIQARGKIPVLLGGTGLYVRAIIEGYQFSPAGSNETLRQQLQDEAQEYGNEFVWHKLDACDKQTAERLHPNDLRRVIRAIEVYHETGRPLSQQYIATHAVPYNVTVIGLNMPKDLLYQRINNRVDIMIEQGLEHEVRQLLDKGYTPDLVSMKSLGYKQMVEYILGEYDFARAVYLIKRDTRHFAKRQVTLFKKIPGIQWFDISQYKSMQILLEDIYNNIAGKTSIK